MDDNFSKLNNELKNCRLCSLCETRTNTVFGIGNPSSKVLLIGEAPGENEDLTGEPFIGRGGKLLDELTETVALSRNKNIYITNMLKCRPPQNRDPLESEMKCCINLLYKQIEVINPKIIICVGRISAQKFIKPDFKVTKEHGVFFEKDGRLVMGTFHPAALLRNPNQRPNALSDWMKLREKILEICPEVYSL